MDPYSEIHSVLGQCGKVFTVMKKAIFFLILAPFFWAGNFIVGRATHSFLSPIELNLYRWTLVVMITLPFGLKGIFKNKDNIVKNLPKLIVLSFMGITLYPYMVYYGLSSSNALNGGIYTALIPVFIIVLSAKNLFGKDNRLILIGTLIAFGGSVFIFTKGDFYSLFNNKINRGDLVLFLSTFIWAIYTIKIKEITSIDSFALVCLISLFGLILFSPILFFVSVNVGNLLGNTNALFSIIYISLFSSVLAYGFWIYGVKNTSASTAGNFMYLLPIFISIMSIVILREDIQKYHLVGGTMILVGLIITVFCSNYNDKTPHPVAIHR
jgi:drug/metabolite transporter (DMT)-like permease